MDTTQLATDRGQGTGNGSPDAVRLEGIVKTFGTGDRKVTAVDGIDLAIRPGEIVAFLGPNGAGKTTTIDMMLGLSPARRRHGRGARAAAPRRPSPTGSVAAVMQTGGLLKDLTVARDRAPTPPACSPTPGRSTRCSQRAGIAEIADRRVGKCSGGEQQRLRFAMALLSDPELLVLDEPTTGMDVEGRRDFWSAIRADADRGPHGAVRDALPRGGRRVRRPDRADPAQGRIVADGTARRDQGLAAGRTVRATLPGRRPGGCSRLPGVETVEVRGDTVLVHTARHRRGRPLPAHRDRRPRPRDHRPRPRGRVPRPDRRRATHHRSTAPSTTADDHSTPDRPPGPAARRLQPHLPRHRDPPDAAQPAHDDLHAVVPAAFFFMFGCRATEPTGPRQRRGLRAR